MLREEALRLVSELAIVKFWARDESGYIYAWQEPEAREQSQTELQTPGGTAGMGLLASDLWDGL